jgi:hypothetical protein
MADADFSHLVFQWLELDRVCALQAYQTDFI